jgi:AraC-like DNA-binding protein
MSQGGRDTWLKPGDMFVTDATQPSEFYYGGQYSEQISLHLPRADILHRFGSRIKGGLSISAKEDLACAMQSILHKLLSPSEVCQSHVLEAFYSVFGAILTDRNLTAGRKLNPDRQIYMRALEAMSHHYNDPNFSTADLAEQLEISLRQLQRAFMLVAETPHSRLQRMRIENAHAALLRLGDQQTITSVAFEHGFSDLSTFYRHFKSQFGITPKQLITQ